MVDYSETFALVLKINTVRVTLFLTIYYIWNLHQFDVKHVFLLGDLEEDIYMDLSPRYGERIIANTVYRLKKSFI